jgi:Tfp pilus assembly protein PilN
MKVRLNLATSPLESHRRFALGAALLGTVTIAALVLLAGNAYRVWRADYALRTQLTSVQKKMDQLRGQRRGLEEFFNQPETLKVRDRAAFINALIEQRSFPWTKIFMDLERNLPEGVRVVSISPKMSGGRVEVKLVIGAATDEGKLKFLRALEASPEFSRIQLLAETRPTRTEESDRVLLELVAWYMTT